MPNGEPVTNFSIATSESWKDKATGEKKERTEWHNIVIYKRLAEIAKQYLRKGSKIYVEGSLRTRKWQDKEGKDRYTTEIIVNEMQMLDGKGGGSAPMDDGEGGGGYQRSSAPSRSSAPAAAPAADQNFEDDDIPF